MKIWTVEEYILNGTDGSFGQFNGHWEFSTKEKAIQAVYNHLREINIDEEDIKNQVKEWDEECNAYGELHCIKTEFVNYDMFDCRYDIWTVELDQGIEV